MGRRCCRWEGGDTVIDEKTRENVRTSMDNVMSALESLSQPDRERLMGIIDGLVIANSIQKKGPAS